MNRIATIVLLAIIILLILIAGGAFGGTLTPRPVEYTPVDYLAAACIGQATDTVVFRFGLSGDIRWIEIVVEDTPGHQQLAAIASFAPGTDGPLLFAEVLTPSGQILRFEGRDALSDSPYAAVCAVTSLWLSRT